MRCKNFKDHLERYSDKALPAKVKKAWEKHLEMCFKCRHIYADFNAMKPLLTGTVIPPAPGNLTANIMRNIRNSQAVAENQNKNNLLQWWKDAAVPIRLTFAIMIFIIVAAGVFTGKDLWNIPDSKGYPQYTELDAFSESQQGSLEDGYFQLIRTSTQEDR